MNEKSLLLRIFSLCCAASLIVSLCLLPVALSFAWALSLSLSLLISLGVYFAREWTVDVM